MIQGRPNEGEFPAHASRYISQVPGDDVLSVLTSQIARTVDLVQSIGDARAAVLRYAPGKWSVKEVVSHMSDTERIFAARLLRIARGDTTPLPGFEENAYALLSGADGRALSDLLHEFESIRHSTVVLLNGLPREAWMRQGTVDSWPCTVRGLAFLIAGHELHHVEVLEQRYLPALESATRDSLNL